MRAPSVEEPELHEKSLARRVSTEASPRAGAPVFAIVAVRSVAAVGRLNAALEVEIERSDWEIGNVKRSDSQSSQVIECFPPRPERTTKAAFLSHSSLEVAEVISRRRMLEL